MLPELRPSHTQDPVLSSPPTRGLRPTIGPLPDQSAKTCRLRTVTRETAGDCQVKPGIFAPGDIQDFLQSPGYDGAGSWSCRVTRLSLALSHCAHCWSRIRVSWHPWTWSQTTFSWQATWGLAVSRLEAGHSGPNTDLHSLRNRALLCSWGPPSAGPAEWRAHRQPQMLQAARRGGCSRNKSTLSIHGSHTVHSGTHISESH